MSTSNVNPKPEYPAVLKELRDIQSQFFDKASNYTRLIFGLGYGGFFVFWSGAKQYLAPRLVVLSALLMSVSLVFFIVFEVAQTGLISYINLRFANAINTPEAEMSVALERFRSDCYKITRAWGTVWVFVYVICVISGFGGVAIVLYSFVRSLMP